MSNELRKRLTREESRAQTYERLLDSARDLFVKAGIDATSIDEVSETAGYSRGAFYSNFESKEALICAVLEREIHRAAGKLDTIFAQDPSPQRLAALRDYYVDFGTDLSGCLFWVTMQVYALQNPGVRSRIAELFRSYRTKLVEHVRLASEESEKLGTPPLTNPEALVFSLTAQALGLSTSWMVDREFIDLDQVRRALQLSFDRLIGAEGRTYPQTAGHD